MKFLALAQQRYSMRSFDTKQITAQDLQNILEAGRLAPTAMNAQSQHILVVQGGEIMEKVKSCTRYHFNAPTILVVCYDSSVSWKNKYTHADGGVFDATIVVTHMMLEAAELGLGSTFVGAFDPAMLREQLNLPDFLMPVALLPLGYSCAESKPHTLHFLRKPLLETVFYDSFDEIPQGKVDNSYYKSLI